MAVPDMQLRIGVQGLNEQGEERNSFRAHALVLKQGWQRVSLKPWQGEAANVPLRQTEQVLQDGAVAAGQVVAKEPAAQPWVQARHG